jgi:tRNA-dihydrouridine synthase B
VSEPHTLSIGNLLLPFPFILAPLAGVSDLAYRLISRSFGVTLAFTEMVSARALTFGNKRCLDMLASTAVDRPLGVQLLGGDTDSLHGALDVLGQYAFDVIDLNAACPVSKVVRRGEGAGLLREPERLRQMIKVLVSRSKAPVTLKIRAGWDENSINAREIALMAEDAGVTAIVIHGRTKVQGYDGRVDYAVIREVKKAVQIPVIGSGDIFSAELAIKMFEETGCDGVAVARGSMGNPWIFHETAELLSRGTVPAKPTLDEVISVMRKHFDLSIGFLGETSGVVSFRKCFIWYTHGLPNVRPLRTKAVAARSISEMNDVIEELHLLSKSEIRISRPQTSTTNSKS